MLATLKSWLRPTHKPQSTRPRLGIQQLEAREVPATLLNLAGNLVIDGTAGHDILELRRSGSTLQVLLGGSPDRMEQEIIMSPGTGRVPVSAFPVSAIRSVNVSSLGGHDWIDLGQSPVWALVTAGDGDDTVHGSAFNDLISGGAGNDRLAAHHGNDFVTGNDGNDILQGGNGDDTLQGWNGDDILYGEVGNDTLNGDGGHDRLYGGAGDDRLHGGAGNDGLYGGWGADRLTGSTGADRFLVRAGLGVSSDAVSEDATVKFHSTPGDAFYRPGEWTEENILWLDGALDNLHRLTGNTRLLKLSDGSNMSGFYAFGMPYKETGVGGWNAGGAITLVSPSSHGSLTTVYHEIAHNWDEAGENGRIPAFRALSGWVQSPAVTTGLTQGSDPNPATAVNDNDWWYRSGTAFASEYSKTNPLEDFATTFEKYCMQRFHPGSGWEAGPTVTAKFANLDLLFADLRS